jgi:hypothetical protein
MKFFETITLIILFLSVTSFNLQKSSLAKEIPPLKSVGIPSGLQGFTNYTTSMFGAAELVSLKNYINSASTFYRDDVEENLRYIQVCMTAEYGGTSYYYGIVIQANSTFSSTNLAIYTADSGNNFATLAPGVNKISPTWSYLAYLVPAQPYLSFVAMKAWGQGSGVNASTATAIQNIIFNYDGTAACTCINTFAISGALESYDGQQWNAICQSYSASSLTYSFVPVNNQ